MEYAPAVRTARTTRPTVVKCTSRNPSAICWELYSPAAWAVTIAASRSLRPANFASGSRRGGLLMDGVSVRIPGMQLFRLDPLSCYLHDCSDCYQPERNGPGGIRTRRKSADFARRTSNSGRLEWLQCKLASNTGFAITQAPGNSLDGSEVRSSARADVEGKSRQRPFRGALLTPAKRPYLNDGQRRHPSGSDISPQGPAVSSQPRKLSDCGLPRQLDSLQLPSGRLPRP